MRVLYCSAAVSLLLQRAVPQQYGAPTPPTLPKTQMKLSLNIGLIEEDLWLACPFTWPQAYGFLVWIFLIQLIVVNDGWNEKFVNVQIPK